MRLARLVLSFVLILSSSSRLNSQQSVATPQRDPQAVAVLTQMLGATGWGRLPSDGVASGIVTRFRADSQDAVTLTVKVRNGGQIRFELEDPASPSTTVVNSGQAVVTSLKETQAIPFAAASSLQQMTMPFFSKFLNLADTSMAFRFVGTETANGQQAYRVEIAQQIAATDLLASVRSPAAKLTIWVATASGLPIQMESYRIATDNMGVLVKHTSQFSDFRLVAGLLIPFHQEEFTGANRLYVLQLDTVQLNVGLTDADFSLAAVQQ